jgi:trehalose-6-phosphate synthase
VLVLSEMAGAAQQLHDALLINPYDVEGFTGAIEQAIDMPLGERRRRMHAMRRIVAGRDIFGWASDILEGLEQLNPHALPPVPGVRPGERERLNVSRVRVPPGAQPS